MNFVNPYPEANDWLITVDGTQYDIWLDSSSRVLTSGSGEAYKLKGGKDLSIDGRLVGKVFARIQAGLSGWATCYMLTTR